MPLAPLALVADLVARGVAVSAEEEPIVNVYLDVASALVRDAAGTPVSQTTSTTTLEGDGSLRLRLPGLPVTSVSAVAVDGQAVTDWTLRSGVLVRDAGWYGDVQVTYTHGLPAVPSDIVDLVCRLVARALVEYRSGDPLSRPVTQERIGDYSVTYGGQEAATMALSAVQRARLAARFGAGPALVRSR